MLEWKLSWSDISYQLKDPGCAQCSPESLQHPRFGEEGGTDVSMASVLLSVSDGVYRDPT